MLGLGIFLLSFCPSVFAQMHYQPLPAGVWRFSTQIDTVPSYDKAYDAQGKVVELHEILLIEKRIRERVKGTVKRDEQRLEFQLDYQWSKNWMVSFQLPYLSRTQDSDLNVDYYGEDAFDGDEDLIQETNQKLLDSLENLKDDQFQGLGDATLLFANETYRSDRLRFLTATGLLLPTGTTDQPKGIFPLAAGERRFGLIGHLQFAYYANDGLLMKNTLDLHVMFNGKSETLTGQEGEIKGNNKVKLAHEWIYDANSLHLASGLSFSTSSETSIDKVDHGDNSSAFILHGEVGFGNLSDLEDGVVQWPYQLVGGMQGIIKGKNHPNYQTLYLKYLMYF